jgi:hypothetical protein
LTPGREIALMPDGAQIRLTPGNHSSPQEGVCVVELASVIAREKFSDRPRCVCPVIGAFLRGWNDRAPHAERQRLGPYAARIVGSRSTARVTRRRRDICLEWAEPDLSQGAARRLVSRTGMRLRIAVFCGMRAALRLSEGAGEYASRVASARRDPESAFELLDTLLAVGERRSPDRRSGAVDDDPGGHLNGNGRPAIVSPDGHPVPNGNEPTSSEPVLDGDPLVGRQAR